MGRTCCRSPVFAKYFQRSPEALGPEEIRAYLVYLTTEKKLAPGNLGPTAGALRGLSETPMKEFQRATQV